MADWYVSSTASGGGAGSELDPWTFMESIAAINDATVGNGDTVWVKNDGTYSITGCAISVSGANNAYKAFSGYNATIGDSGVAYIARSGGTGDLLTAYSQNYWVFRQLKLNGAGAGLYNLKMGGSVGNPRAYAINIESYSAGSVGIYGGSALNCWSYNNASYGFQNIDVYNCIANNNGNNGYHLNSNTSVAYNSIAKSNSGVGFYIPGWLINSIADGNTGHQVQTYSDPQTVILNCIIVNSPVGKYGIYCTDAKNVIGWNIDFYNNSADTNYTSEFVNTYALDPQFKDTANLDYTRTGTNLDGKGFSQVGLTSFDYSVDIGVDQKTAATTGGGGWYSGE